jgi:hypothetical protein
VRDWTSSTFAKNKGSLCLSHTNLCTLKTLSGEISYIVLVKGCTISHCATTSFCTLVVRVDGVFASVCCALMMVNDDDNYNMLMID